MSNPVVETFGELFEKLKDRSAEEAKPGNPFGLFTQKMFDQALQQAAQMNPLWSGTIGMLQGVTMYKAPSDTIAYDVNNPATWSNFLPPEFLEAELPATPKRKRKGKK